MKLACTNQGSASVRRSNHSNMRSTMNAVSVSSGPKRTGAHHSLCAAAPG